MFMCIIYGLAIIYKKKVVFYVVSADFKYPIRNIYVNC